VAGVGFDASVWEMWPYLTAGASVWIPPVETVASPPGLLAWIAEQRITLAFLPTPLAEAALAGPLRALFDVANIVEMTEAIAAQQAQQVDQSEMAAMLDELKGLSPEEIRALLEAEG